MSALKPSFVAGPYRPNVLLREFVLSPFEPASWRAAGAIVMGFFVGTFSFALLATCFSMGGSFMIFLVGFAIVGLGIELCRVVARIERWRAIFVDPRPLRPHPYRQFGHGLRAVAEAEFMDENRWRDVIYVLVSFPLTILEFVLTVALWAASLALLLTPILYYGVARTAGDRIPVEVVRVAPVLVAIAFVGGLVLLPVAASVARGLMVLHRAVVEGLLCTSEREELRQRVENLRESRSAMLQVEASELRRIERDLHDGAQQRLVMLAIDLSLASDRVDTDPAGAKALMNDAREQARQALAELRDLVRGAAPAILLDRGLVAALGSVAGRCPVPTVVESTLPAGQRQPHAVERAAYFVVAEALTNVAKHAGATRCEVRCRQGGDRLVVEVWDDGKGGANAAPGGGLAGLRDRVEALDGLFRIDSPAGGPTLLHAEMPLGPDQGP
ncbi:MAG: sensor domain-containing protein [Candidatus Limnocylindrales bacterium]